MRRTNKRVRVAYPCRVCSQDCTVEQDSIQCDGCECWLHQQCVGLTHTQFVAFSAAHLQFFCLHCIGIRDKDGFNFPASLSRIAACAPVLSDMRLKAASELQLLQFYNIVLPDVRCVAADHVAVHSPSVAMLRDNSPWILDHFVPAAVQGDGNCLFRAVSFALYGDEKYHTLLRLLTAIECLLYPTFYDSASADYYQPYRVDACLVLSDYTSFTCAVVKNGACSDMHTVLALSAVVQKPIQTRWPILPRDTWASPMTKLVVGRNVQTEYPVSLLWSVGDYPGAGIPLNINHFVPMISVSSATSAQVYDAHDSTQEDESDVAVDSSRKTTVVDERCPMADGRSLPGRFMSLAECVQHLNTETPVTEHIPNGIKENVWFKVSTGT